MKHSFTVKNGVVFSLATITSYYILTCRYTIDSQQEALDALLASQDTTVV